MTAPLPFLSAEWVAACGRAINASESYRLASTEWTHGAVALVVTREPLQDEPVGLWLDLDRGACREARLVSAADAAAAPFVLTGSYPAWRRVLARELKPLPAIMTRQLTLRGSWAILARFMRSAEELVAAATSVPTAFPDD